MIIDPNWTFSELSKNIKRLKKEYIFYLAFFSYHENDTEKLKRENKYKKATRDMFYAMNLKEWQKDIAWEFMNNYLPYSVIKGTAQRIDRKKKRC